MNKIVMVLGLSVALIASGCTTETRYGPCIGVQEDRNPAFHYRLSKWNVFLAVIGVETVVIPLVVAFDDAMCPVSKNPVPESSN